jgi:hypothetical protein
VVDWLFPFSWFLFHTTGKNPKKMCLVTANNIMVDWLFPFLSGFCPEWKKFQKNVSGDSKFSLGRRD